MDIQVYTVLSGYKQSPTVLCFSPDGRYIVSGDIIGNINVCDIKNNYNTYNCIGHDDEIFSICVSPDNKYIISGSRDKLVKIWDIENGQIVHTFNFHSHWVVCVCSSVDGKYIASTSTDNTINVINMNTKNIIHTFKNEYKCNVIDQIKIRNISFTPDGKYIISGCDNKTIKLWNIENNNDIILNPTLIYTNDNINKIFVSPNGEYFATYSTNGFNTDNSINKITLWNLKDKIPIFVYDEECDPYIELHFSADNNYILTTSKYWHIKIWSIQERKKICDFKSVGLHGRTVCFSPDGKYVASVCINKKITLWNVSFLNIIPSNNIHKINVLNFDTLDDLFNSI